MSLILNFVNFLSFLSGIAFGLFLCFVAVVHYFGDHKKTKDELNTPLPDNKSATDVDSSPAEESVTQIKGKYIPQKLSKQESTHLTEIIDFLDELNSPLKNMGTVMERIHQNKELELASLEGKMKTIIETPAILKLEKEFQDTISQLKDHSKQIKLISSFLYDLGKVFSNFSRDISKLSHNARNNMNKGTQTLDRKEDMICNNWWQTLNIALDSMGNDQEDLATIVNEELINYSNQIQEEITIIEKRLASEGNRQFAALRENISQWETKLKERDKAKEKLRNTPIQASPGNSDSYQRRAQRLKAADDALVLQTRKLYEVQKDFYCLLPRINSDVQITILKSIVETQSQLMKLTEGIDRLQSSNHSICARMKTQLTNAASSLVQMIREENNLITQETMVNNMSVESSIALSIMKQRMLESGVKGFELNLQKVLEGLMIQSQLKDLTTQSLNIPIAAYSQGNNLPTGATAVAGVGPDLSKVRVLEDLGKLDMFQEATACLAASNPSVLPELPKSFAHSIGTETCVWFNAFSGRVYRDLANSEYFYNWFCTKLAHMLNKKGKERPAYIDKFEVTEVTFGELPPLLLNVKWSPMLKKRDKETEDKKKDKSAKSEKVGDSSLQSEVTSSKKVKNNAVGLQRASSYKNLADDDDDDDDDEGEDPGNDNDSGSEGSIDENDAEDSLKKPKLSPEMPDVPLNATHEDQEFYAACTADMAFRSGIKFTVATKIWINWPRDRYASVPVIFYIDLAELSGRIRFGVERSHSFLTFLKDPVTRMTVRSEVGGDKYKLKDIPQISDFIVKKLKKFIHRKIVHPHAHRFRLIWPRNWWPKGTENLFMPTEGVSSRSGSPVPSPQKDAKKAAAGSSARIPSNDTGTSAGNNLGDSLASAKSSVHTPLPVKARPFDLTASPTSSGPSQRVVVADGSTSQHLAPPIPEDEDEYDGSAGNDMRETFSLSAPQFKEAKWLQHLKDLSERPFPEFSSREKVRVLKQFYMKQRRKESDQTLGTSPPMDKTPVTPPARTAAAPAPSVRLVRSLSIADFRTSTAEVILEELLEKMQSKLDTIDTVMTMRRSSFTAPGTVTSDSRRSVKKRSNSIISARDDESSGWLTEKSREAKAKFLEFKNKHFGNKDKAAAGPSEAEKGANDVGDLDKLKSSAARLGGKLKNFFKMNEDEPPAGGGARRTSTRMSGSTLSAASQSPGPVKGFSEADDSLQTLSRSPDSNADGSLYTRKRQNSTDNPRSADVGLEDSSSAASKGSTMKFVASMFRGSTDAASERESRQSMEKSSRVNAMFSKALHSVRHQLDKDKET